MTPDFSSLKHAREQFHIHLRSQKRIQVANARRFACAPPYPFQIQGAAAKVAQMVLSADRSDRLAALEVLKSALTEDGEVRGVLDGGLVAVLGTLAAGDNAEVASSAVWCLAMVSAHTLTDADIAPFLCLLPTLVGLITADRVSTAYLAMWVVANLCRQSPCVRHNALRLNVVGAVVAVLISPLNSDVKAVTWTLGHILGPHYEGTFEPDWVRAMVAMLERNSDEDVWTEVVAILVTVTEAIEALLPVVLERRFWVRIVKLLESSNEDLRFAALRLVGNLAKGPHAYSLMLIDYGVFDPIANLLRTNKGETHHEALWTLSNLCVSPTRLIVNKLISLNVFPRVIRLIKQEFSYSGVPGLYVLANILIENSWLVVDHLLSNSVIDCIFTVLRTEHPSAAGLILEVLTHLLEISTEASLDLGRNLAVEEIEEKRLVGEIERLEMSRNEEVERKAGLILERYFYGGLAEVNEDGEELEDEVSMTCARRPMRFS